MGLQLLQKKVLNVTSNDFLVQCHLELRLRILAEWSKFGLLVLFAWINRTKFPIWVCEGFAQTQLHAEVYPAGPSNCTWETLEQPTHLHSSLRGPSMQLRARRYLFIWSDDAQSNVHGLEFLVRLKNVFHAPIGWRTCIANVVKRDVRKNAKAKWRDQLQDCHGGICEERSLLTTQRAGDKVLACEHETVWPSSIDTKSDGNSALAAYEQV